MPDFAADRDLTLPSLEPEHFSVDHNKGTDYGQAYRFRNCRAEKSLFDSVLKEHEKDIDRRCRLIRCGESAVVEATADGSRYRVKSFTCGSRHCPVCKIAIAIERAEVLTRMVSTNPVLRWKFITLTLQSNDDPLSDQLDHLQKSFRRLRQQHTWKRAVKGGRAVIELTYNLRRKQWHPHIHILADAAYIEQHRLSAAWFEASSSSTIVDIRAVKSREEAAGYLAKYLSKSFKHPDPFHARRLLAELYLATRGRKLLISFGDVPPEEELPFEVADPEIEAGWRVIGTLNAIVSSANLGDLRSKAILQSLGFSP